MNILYRNIISMACMVACMLLLSADAAALPLDTYAPTITKLSSGHWVKSKSPIPAYTGLLPTSCANGDSAAGECARIRIRRQYQNDILNAVTYTTEISLLPDANTSRGAFLLCPRTSELGRDPLRPISHRCTTIIRPTLTAFLSDAPGTTGGIPPQARP